MSTSIFPDVEKLTAALNNIFCGEGRIDSPVVVTKREPAIYASTAPSETVTCRLANKTEFVLFCKYGGRTQHSHGTRGGVTYEAEVYRRVLQPLKISKATFCGAYEDVATGETWLFLEYLDKCVRLSKTWEEEMRLTARWLGHFHAINEARLSTESIPFLKVYDVEYYLGWPKRTLQFAGDLNLSLPWLDTLCKRWNEVVTDLLLPSTTVVHCEFYPHNILIRDGIVYPIDWESAAIAVGEIDLVALTDDWPEEVVQQCELEYQKARWLEGAPSYFQRRLNAARLFQDFRWLGDRDITKKYGISELYKDKHSKLLRRFEKLRSVGEQLGLI